jgi:hypothetical protein
VSPVDGPFSVLAWVKGGAPGQTILAQGLSAWLTADLVHGRLATELQLVGRSGGQLCSPTIITDGAWHRVGCTWDGANRRLYVDEVLVAEDTQDRLAAATGRLIIGGGKTMAPGTFWTGLIDDVRIYTRAVKP